MLWGYENNDKIDSLKAKLKYFVQKSHIEKNNSKDAFQVEANAYNVIVSNEMRLVDNKYKTSFLLYDSKEINFDIDKVKIYLQNGFLVQKNNEKKLVLNKNFTLELNGGIKTVVFNNSKSYGLVTSLNNDCYYISFVDLSNGNELFNTKCLPNLDYGSIDFNGVGSSVIYDNDFILISIGTPTTDSYQIDELAQDKSSYFGKILKINKTDFKKEQIDPEIFSIGHRNPQGMTKIKNKYFSLEHGPKGGDEINEIKINSNYGWPIVSYGTKYLYNQGGQSYNLNHENKGFSPPIYAFIPSLGVSSLNICPSILVKYYKKNCLIGLSLHGNKLQSGNSLIIILFNNSFTKVSSIEKIFLKDNFPIRHFLTNQNNEIYENIDGSIYVSIDSKGIYKIKFKDFR